MTVGDWDRRELCPDGTCTGLIGPEGTCKVCGRAAPNWGDERQRGLATPNPDDPDDDPDDDDDDDEVDDDVDGDDDDDAPDPIAPSTPASIGGGAWTARKLCTDGACVGVIGPDGTCKVCGKPAFVGRYDVTVAEDDESAAAASDKPADDDANRMLCSDGACIGVIGPNGTCKVCGKPASGAATADEPGGEAEDDGEDDADDEYDDGDDDEGDDADEDGDPSTDDDDELAAAADELAGIATHSEVAAAKDLASAAQPVAAATPAPMKPAKTKSASVVDDENRQLCPDGACIGVIGPDGRCKICKKAAA